MIASFALVPAVQGQTTNRRAVAQLAAGHAAAFGCDSTSIMRAAAEVLQARRQQQWQPDEPQVGDPACLVLAALGLPDRERHIATEFGESWYWIWLIADEPRLVSVERPGRNTGGVLPPSHGDGRH